MEEVRSSSESWDIEWWSLREQNEIIVQGTVSMDGLGNEVLLLCSIRKLHTNPGDYIIIDHIGGTFFCRHSQLYAYNVE
jgi:hypothetical protein